MTEVRELIANRLIGAGTYPWGDRVVETAAADPDVMLPPFGEQPWLLVKQTGVTVDLNRQQTVVYEVSVYASNTSFAELDALERGVVAILADTTLTDPGPPSISTSLRYAGTLLGDQVIVAWDAYCRTLRFDAAGGSSSGAWHFPDDPRAAYLRANVGLLFCSPSGDCVQSDPTTWVPTDDCPGVYFRPESGPNEIQRYFGVTFFRETIAGHVVAETREAQQAWVDKLALELPGQLDYVQPEEIDSNGNLGRVSTLLLRVTALNPAADAATAGQLRIEVQFSALECGNLPEPDYGPLRYVDIIPHPSTDALTPPGDGPDLHLPLDPALGVADFSLGRRR